jgi:hypothetical protein
MAFLRGPVTRLGSMPGIRATLGALAVVACAAGLAACGGDEEGGPIPQDAGETLIAQLDEIESAVQAGDCTLAQTTALDFAQGVNDLPTEVSGELRTRLVEASANLEELSQTQCQEPATGPTGETGVVPPTTTTSTTETTTTTDTTTEEPSPDENNGNGPPIEPPGGGNPGGNSGGGSGEGDDSSGGIGSDG